MQFQPEKLRAARTRKKLSVRALARATGVTECAVRLWEKGACTPSLENLGAMASALGHSPLYFVEIQKKGGAL